MIKLCKRMFFVLVTFGLLLAVVGCDKDDLTFEISLKEFSATMLTQENQDVTIELSNEKVDLTKATITWESLTPELASISTDGKITALAAGDAKFKVTVATEDYSKEYEFTVKISSRKYKITYALDGGTNPSDAIAEFTEGSSLDLLPTPTKEGYNFLGWFVNDEEVEAIDSDITLTAKWEYIPKEFTITYVLDGGTNPSGAITKFTEGSSLDLLPTPTKEGYNFLGWFVNDEEVEAINSDVTLTAKWEYIPKEFTITYVLNGGTNPSGAITKFTEGSSLNILPTPTKEGYNFLGWFVNDEEVEAINSDVTLTAKWELITYTITYDLRNGNWAENQVGATEYEPGSTLTIPSPVRTGYEFVEWRLDGVKFTGVEATTKGNLNLVAVWNKDYGEATVIRVSATGEYKTLAEALAVATEGVIIVLEEGTYEGTTITVKGVIIEGPNASIDPNKSTREPEATFTSDIIVKADDVTIDGIKLTGAARIVGDKAGTKNTTIKYVYSYASTVNGSASDSTTAPICFYTNVEGAVFENLVLSNLRYEGSTGRPMILYGAQIVNITVKDSEFVGTRSNYNDGIKLEGAGGGELNSAFGVKGNVTITGNLFENYSQYVLWFREYAEGTYTIENNIFKNCGQTAGSHAAASFITYKGATDGVAEINFQYNTVENSYILVRIDVTAGLTSDILPVKISYNKMYGCSTSTVYVLNKNEGFKVDATNNFYDKAPTASMFTNATWQPYYDDAANVPVYGEELSIYNIEYVLDGGTNPESAPVSYDSKVGLSTLPTPTKEGLVFVGWYLENVKVDSIPVDHTGDITLTAKWRQDALYVGSSSEDYYYATLALALAAAKDGDTIIIEEGTYNENVTISVSNLTIIGPNANVNPNTTSRENEAIFTGSMTINTSAKGLVINGLAFTGTATITGGQVLEFTFMNNYIYDTTKATTAWAETNTYKEGFIYFCGATGTESNELAFINNKFENVSNVNVSISYSKDVTFDGNIFKNFERDAIRFNNGGYNYGILAFTNNEFLQDTLGGYNGIYFRIYGGPGINDTTILIEGNKFVNIGNSSAGLYSGAISARNYQEKGTDIIIKNNEFNKCLNFIRIRNNGTAANHAISTWSCLIENNNFIGVPATNYFANWNATDGASSNPENTVFAGNYYEDNDGNVLTDMAVIGEKIFNSSNKGTALSAKVELESVEPVIFYHISYELGGGTGTELVYMYHRLSGAIPLSDPTWNIYQEFVEWQINGQVVTEIAEGSKGDITVVAIWRQLEGDPCTINLVLNGGNYHYDSFDDISADLLKDYNAYAGTNYNTENLPKGAWTLINIHNFFYSEGMQEKWTWLAKYLGAVGGSANKAGCLALTTKADVTTFDNTNTNYKYAVSYEFRAFMIGSEITSNGSYKSSNYSDVTLREQVWSYLNEVQSTEILTTVGREVTLPTLHKPYLSFVGWYDNAEFTGDPVEKITPEVVEVTYYAKFIDLNPVTEVNVTNAVTTLKRFETLQLVCEVLPASASNKTLKFSSSNPAIATVSSDGLITAIANGEVTITITSSANDRVSTTMTFTVVTPNYINAEFATNSYVQVGETIEINANIVGQTTGTITWQSMNPEIATVENGVVSGVSAGIAIIKLVDSSDPNVSLEISVVVLSSDIEGILAEALNQNNPNVFLKAELGIGAGTPAYYEDILGSVSKILFEEYEVKDDYYATGNANSSNHGGTKTSTEFITVHYTGNMSASAGAAANANYFVNAADVSIHYVTGNDGIYHCLDDSKVAFHAGDGTAVTFSWNPTGVMAGANDPKYPVFGITANSKFSINGVETTISVPTGTTAATTKVTDSRWINDMGLAFKVVDGQYYLGTTWWCYSQVAEGRICSKGGNLNSIGIESAVNEGSDLWYTWQKTAQLVAHLMVENNLDITRVVGHHFYSAKDCPQPLLENDMEIWWEFIDLVEHEYEMLTTYEGYTVECVSNNPDIVDNRGRIISQPEFTTCVTYTLTFTKGAEVKTITLSSIVPGIYEK